MRILLANRPGRSGLLLVDSYSKERRPREPYLQSDLVRMDKSITLYPSNHAAQKSTSSDTDPEHGRAETLRNPVFSNELTLQDEPYIRDDLCA